MKEKKLSIGDVIYLMDLGITTIYVDYSGGGDSGAIDAIAYINPKIKDLSADIIPEKIKQRVEKKAYDLLENIDDWYNNEGGYGTIDINVSSLYFDIDAHYYKEAPSEYNEETGDYEYDYDNQGEWSESYHGVINVDL